jgi:putative transposase
MARLPRLVVPFQAHHIIQRGTDRRAIFLDDEDHAIFIKWLRESAKNFKVAIHAYVLMPNHLHLLATPVDETGLARMMQWLGRHYVPYFNKKYERFGTLWQGRYRATVIDSEQYFMLCSRYIELNPVRGGICNRPEEFPWSSYRHHAGIAADTLLTDHALYWALGNTPFSREASYRALVDQAISAQEITELSAATLKGWALGSDKFKNRLEKQANRRVSRIKRGRPFSINPNPATAEIKIPD